MTSLLLSIAMAKLLMPVAQQELAKNQELQKLGAKYCRLFLSDSERGSAAFRCDRQQSYTGQVYGKH